MKKRYLTLANGRTFEGEAFGADAGAVGELVFTTGMCGYLETLTDPSYYGQIILQTFPLIGNYGVIEEDFEGTCRARGYVVREWCDHPSNFRAQYDIDKLLKKWNVPGICGVDTREITRALREEGVMNAMISDKPPEALDEIKHFAIRDAVAAVSAGKNVVYPAPDAPKYRVALIDYGAKHNIIRELNRRGCTVVEVPYNAAADEIMALRPDGVMLSNGPGDPAENTACVETLKALLGKIPMFGICLGHQLLALAAGGRTVKLKYGHRGANQPVKDLSGGRTYITSQNHGYAVEADSLDGIGVLTHVNANDQTCEGLSYPNLRAFSVQFHPEACAGPCDTSFLFDRFTDLMGGAQHAAD